MVGGRQSRSGRQECSSSGGGWSSRRSRSTRSSRAAPPPATLPQAEELRASAAELEQRDKDEAALKQRLDTALAEAEARAAEASELSVRLIESQREAQAHVTTTHTAAPPPRCRHCAFLRSSSPSTAPAVALPV